MKPAFARIVALLPALAAIAFTQQLAPPQREIPLYPGPAPGSENWNWEERQVTTGTGLPMVQNVVRPVLQYYPAVKSKAVGTAMIVAPGGGFRNLMMSYEGVDVAAHLNALGIEAFILKYRLTYTAAGAPAGGAGPQAGQNVRELAGADGQHLSASCVSTPRSSACAPDRIGMIGYSAGGAVTLAAVAGPPDGRPDFAAPIYAAGAGTISPAQGAPPLFIAVAADDKTVGFQGSIDLFAAWRKTDLPAELHIFQTGAHGFGKRAVERTITWTVWTSGSS